jgi:hypothetical protein
MQTDAESAAQRLRRNATALVLVEPIVAGLSVLLVAAWLNEEDCILPCGCPPMTPTYLTATIGPWTPTPGPGTPWPTVVSIPGCL